MRKIIMATIVGFALSSTVSAQTKGDVELGFNVGFNTSSAASTTLSYDQGKGFNVGGSIHYYISKSWSIEGKLIYDQKGWDNGYIADEEGNRFGTDINLNYLTVPIMANYYFGAEDKKNWFIEFGPYSGILLSAKDTRFGADLKNSFQSNDFGLAIGAGVKIPVNNWLKVFFEIEGQTGFSNIFNDSSSMKNSRTGFNVGLNYLLK